MGFYFLYVVSSDLSVCHNSNMQCSTPHNNIGLGGYDWMKSFIAIIHHYSMTCNFVSIFILSDVVYLYSEIHINIKIWSFTVLSFV